MAVNDDKGVCLAGSGVAVSVLEACVGDGDVESAPVGVAEEGEVGWRGLQAVRMSRDTRIINRSLGLKVIFLPFGASITTSYVVMSCRRAWMRISS